MAGAAVRLEGVEKRYGDGPPAVRDLALDIGGGDFFSLLGPSGCGKTTTLMMLAGFERPSRGRIVVDGRDITDLPPHRRDIGVVFQSYALFPHRTVLENVAFGLRMRRVPPPELARRVGDALRLVELEGLEGRYPRQLSGGQQQRVALARAVVIEPKMLLMDEPLGALDKRLRRAMQFELKELQRRLGVTLVYVTHDQEEALTMSDRIAVMNAGRLEQADTPEAVYARPRTAFVADFIGDSNLFRGRVVALPDGGRALRTERGEILPLAAAVAPGTLLAVALRPEHLSFSAAPGDGRPALPARVIETNFLGGGTLLKLRTERGETVLARATGPAGSIPRPGQDVLVGWDPASAVLLEERDGAARDLAGPPARSA